MGSRNLYRTRAVFNPAYRYPGWCTVPAPLVVVFHSELGEIGVDNLQGAASVVDVLALESLRKTAAWSGCVRKAGDGGRTVIAAVATAASAIWTSAWTLPDGSKTSMPLHRSTEDLSRASPCLVNTTIFCGMPCRTNIWCRTSTCGQTQRRCPHAADAHSDRWRPESSGDRRGSWRTVTGYSTLVTVIRRIALAGRCATRRRNHCRVKDAGVQIIQRACWTHRRPHSVCFGDSLARRGLEDGWPPPARGRSVGRRRGAAGSRQPLGDPPHPSPTLGTHRNER